MKPQPGANGPDHIAHGDLSSEVDRQTAFVRLLGQHYRAMYSYAISLGADLNQADDVMQDVSVVLWDQFDRYDPETSFVRWGRVVVRNVYRNHRRAFWRRRCTFSPELIEKLFETQCAAEELLEIRLVSLRRCLKLLPRSDRKLLSSYYEKGQSLTETARIHGKAAGTLHKAISRIRMKLSNCIDLQMGIDRE